MLPNGRHALGPETATLQVRTNREGAMGKAGHDLVMDAKSWQGSLAVAGDEVTLEITVDSRALNVRWGMNGTTQLTDENRASIGETIDTKVLKGVPISFRSRTSMPYGDSMMISGDLTIGQVTRTIKFELRTNGDGSRVDAIARITQSDFGIKPYTAMLGALKVRDVVEIVATARLPLWEAPVGWSMNELAAAVAPVEAAPEAPVEAVPQHAMASMHAPAAEAPRAAPPQPVAPRIILPRWEEPRAAQPQPLSQQQAPRVAEPQPEAQRVPEPQPEAQRVAEPQPEAPLPSAPAPVSPWRLRWQR